MHIPPPPKKKEEEKKETNDKRNNLLPLYPTQVTQEGTTSFRMKIDTTLLE
jgi:hypothetical protein